MKIKLIMLLLFTCFGQISSSELITKLKEYKKEIGIATGTVATAVLIYKAYQKFCELNRQIELLQEGTRIFGSEFQNLMQICQNLDQQYQELRQEYINSCATLERKNIDIQVLEQANLALIQQKKQLILKKFLLVKRAAELDRNNGFAQIQYANLMQQLREENYALKAQLEQLQNPQSSPGSELEVEHQIHPQEESKEQEEQKDISDSLETLSRASESNDIAQYEFKDVQEFTEAIHLILKKDDATKFNIVLLKFDQWLDEIGQIKALINSKIQIGEQKELWQIQLVKIEAIEAELNNSPWKNGEKIMQELNQDYIENIKSNKNAHLKAIVDLIWYFYYLAVKKDQYFTEGAFGIVYNKDLIYNLLLSYEDIYERNGNGSSHFKEEDEVIQYGLDVPYNLCLPNGMTHILFGDMHRRGYLFVKTEPHGLGNLQDTVGHTFGYITSVYKKLSGCNNKNCYRKEHLPDLIKKLWKEFIKQYSIVSINDISEASSSSVAIAAASSLASVASGLGSMVSAAAGFTQAINDIYNSGIKYGISQMRYNLHHKIFKNSNEAQIKAREALLEEIKKYDNLEYRKGNEVILTQEDFVN